MHGEFYQLLIATRPQLLRWWRSAGWWWLVPMLLAIGANAAEALIIEPGILGQLPESWCMADYRSAEVWGLTAASWQAIASIVVLLARCCLVICWLLAATVASDCVSAIITDLPVPTRKAWMRARYPLMIIQGAPPVAVALLYWLINTWWLKNYLFAGAEVMLTQNHPRFEYFMLPMMWALALLAVAPRQPYLAWLWAAAAVLAPMALYMYVDVIQIVEGYTYWRQRPSIEYYLPVVGYYWELGALGVVLMLWLFARRQYALALIGLFFCLLSGGVDSWDDLRLWPPQEHPEVKMLLLTLAHAPQDFITEPPVPGVRTWWYNRPYECEILIQQPVRAKLTIWRGWSFVGELINLAYILLVYMFIHRLFLSWALPRRC